MFAELLIYGNAYRYRRPSDGQVFTVQYRGIVKMRSTQIVVYTFRFQNERGNACGLSLRYDEVSKCIEQT